MATITMRQVRPGEVPRDGGTAIQEDSEYPVFHGNGPDDYICVTCGNLLAAAMHPVQMTKKVRIRCGRCCTVNVSVIDGYELAQGSRGVGEAQRPR
jgi:phage FluMu protein Com